MGRLERKSEEAASDRKGPPDRHSALVSIVANGEPAPEEPENAVNWFMWLFENPDGVWEKPSEYQLRGKDSEGAMGWHDPYITRMKFMIPRFRAADTDLRNYVIAAREDDMYWRGESFEQFKTVLGEYVAMREAIAEKGKGAAMGEMIKRARRDMSQIGRS